MAIRANQSMTGVMNHVLGSVVHNMWSSFEQVQQQSVYTSATNFLTGIGIQTCSFVNSNNGLKCTDKCVQDKKTGTLSDFCRSHKYKCEKDRELKHLREQYGIDEKRKEKSVQKRGSKRLYIDSDDEDGIEILGTDDTHKLQPSSKQQLPLKYVISNKKHRGEPEKQPTVSSPNATPGTSTPPMNSGPQPQIPVQNINSPERSDLADILKKTNLDQEMEVSHPEKSKDAE